jgi:anthranilate synthase component 2
MKILVLDNYDSFTYNLVHYIERIENVEVDVFRNDEISLAEIEKYDKIVLSPGPGIPDEAGILKDVIREFSGKKPIFGVCLGLQAITEVFGGKIFNMDKVYHGVATEMKVTSTKNLLFRNLPEKFEAGRYHSWAAETASFPDSLEVTATDEFGTIMALSHKTLDVHAVQFHPESVLTPLGQKIIENFILSK